MINKITIFPHLFSWQCLETSKLFLKQWSAGIDVARMKILHFSCNSIQGVLDPKSGIVTRRRRQRCIAAKVHRGSHWPRGELKSNRFQARRRL